MFARLFSIAFVSVLAVAAQAQLPSERFSPINYFGRYHGFGYSDGYHACKEVRCNSWSMSKPWESMSKHWESPSKTWASPSSPGASPSSPWASMSSLYGSLTPSSSNRAVGIQATANTPLVSREYYATPIIKPSAPVTETEWSPPSLNSYESVPSAPLEIKPSSSDRGVRALPQLGTKSEFIPSPPQVRSRTAPIGSYFEP